MPFKESTNVRIKIEKDNSIGHKMENFTICKKQNETISNNKCQTLYWELLSDMGNASSIHENFTT